MPTSGGTNRCVDLNATSIYSSYNNYCSHFVRERWNKIPVVIDLFMFSGIYLDPNYFFKLYFEKTMSFQLSPLQGILVCLYRL